jgi:peptidoglycan-N-acetylglucosamine deacetylase
MLIGLIVALLAATVLAHVAPFPFILDAASGKKTVWRMPDTPDRRLVYLTFDDGPNPVYTPMLLDLLRDKSIRASFFVIDRHLIPETAPIVRRMFLEGHCVGLHSADRWLMAQSASDVSRTLKAAADRMESFTGFRPAPLFRPHAGWRSVSMLRGLARLNFRLVGWSWKTWDWSGFRQRTAAHVSSQIISNAEPGKIIVIHDGHHRDQKANRQYAVEATARIIDELRRQGFEFGVLWPREEDPAQQRAVPSDQPEPRSSALHALP